MKKHTRLTVLAAAALGLLATGALADDLASVEKKISAGWKNYKTMSAKVVLSQHMNMGGMSMETNGNGTQELMRQGDKTLSRFELKMAMTRKMGEQEMKMEQEMLQIIDGDITHMLVDAMGQKTAFKSKTKDSDASDPELMFAAMHKDSEVKLLPEETIAGAKMYVIESTPKEKAASPGAPQKTIMYFNQATCQLVKMIAHDQTGAPMMTMEYSDFKFDEPIDPDRFKFVLPEGVQLMDQTKVDG